MRSTPLLIAMLAENILDRQALKSRDAGSQHFGGAQIGYAHLRALLRGITSRSDAGTMQAQAHNQNTLAT